MSRQNDYSLLAKIGISSSAILLTVLLFGLPRWTEMLPFSLSLLVTVLATLLWLTVVWIAIRVWGKGRVF